MHFLELGFRCNNSCVFCAQGRLRDQAPASRIAALLASADSVAPGEDVALVGGEPTLLDELPVLVQRVRERGARTILIQTNGRRLAVPGVAEALASAGVTALDVSLHGANEATHDYHTSVKDSFRQTVAGLRRARASRLSFVTSTVITRSNFRHLAEIVRVAHALGARAVRFQCALPAGNAARGAVVPSWPMVRPHLIRAVALARQLGVGCVAPDAGVVHDVPEGWFAGPGHVESPDPSAETQPFDSASSHSRRVDVGVLLHGAQRAVASPDRPIAGPSH